MSLTTEQQQALLTKQVQDWKKELARLASQIELATGKNAAVVLIQSVDDDYARASSDSIVDDGLRVMPGYEIELLNPQN